MPSHVLREQAPAVGPVTTVVDETLCIGCGQCIAVCPSQTLSMVEDKARVTGEKSLQCGHCEAVCPVEAIRVEGLDRDIAAPVSFPAKTTWSPPGHGGPEAAATLHQLLLSRRSCRNFTSSEVPRHLLDDLVRFAVTAPSGTNSQRWTFSILPDRRAVAHMANLVADFFGKLNRMAEKPWLRAALKLTGKPQLQEYRHNYYDAVERALTEWRQDEKDRLFHGAPAAILVGTTAGASCPAEDCLLAAQNMLLGAHALGLGTCLVGYAVAAMHEDPAIARTLGLPTEKQGETIHAVIAVGWPDETYRAVCGRRTPLVREVTAP